MALASLSRSLLSKMSLSSSPGTETVASPAPLPKGSTPPISSINSSEPIAVLSSAPLATLADDEEVSGTVGDAEKSSFLLGSFSPIRTMELYPPKVKVIEEGCSYNDVPFDLLSGENVEYLASLERTELVGVTNYRLLATHKEGAYSVPIGMIEGVELQANKETATFLCRDGRVFRLIFPSHLKARSFYNHFQTVLREATGNHKNLFAFVFHASRKDLKLDQKLPDSMLNRTTPTHSNTGYCREELITAEYRRMGMGPALPESHSSGRMWRISQCNSKYEVCSTYPKLLVVPNSVPDQEIVAASKFRMLGRLPVVVWRHQGNGCVMARSSQPLVGVFNWRSGEDEKLLLAISRSCTSSGGTCHTSREEQLVASSDFNDPTQLCVGSTGLEDRPGNGHVCSAPPQLVVIDLRSYAVTLGNRAKGGGSECVEYYPNCEIRFKGLPNIHSVRKSFQHLRAVLAVDDQVSFLSNLESTQWLVYLCELLCVGCEVVEVLQDCQQPILVHCSDGWDRTSHVVALAQLMLDPYYRTIQGFRVLLEREWLLFGHKFGDRCGHTSEDGNQRCPVFLQWLDCVHQLVMQFPCSFQFNEHFLVKLGQHAYSGLFGTFLGNNMKEREAWRLEDETTPIWAFLHQDNPDILNYLYNPPRGRQTEVLRPVTHIQKIFLWKAMYCVPVLSTCFCSQPYQLDIQSDDANQVVDEEAKIIQTDDKSKLNEKAGKSCPDGGAGKQGNSSSVSSLDGLNLILDAGDKSEEDEGKEGHDPCPVANNSNRESTVSQEQTSKIEEESCEADVDLEGSLSTHEYHENLHKRLSKSVSTCDESRSSEPLDIPSSDSMKGKKVVSSPGNGHIPGHAEMHHKFGGEHLTLKAQTSFQFTSIEMKPINRGFDKCNWRSGNLQQQSPISQQCHYRLDMDGLPVSTDEVQGRLQEIMLAHRKELRRLNEQLVRAKHEARQSGGKEDKVDLRLIEEEVADLLSEKESPSSLVSWDCVDENGEGVRWIPDHAVTHCYGCGNTFWTVNRKHHCRSCGQVFCGSCSDYYCPVPTEQLFSDVRVCEKCFYKLDGHLYKKSSQVSAPNTK